MRHGCGSAVRPHPFQEPRQALARRQGRLGKSLPTCRFRSRAVTTCGRRGASRTPRQCVNRSSHAAADGRGRVNIRAHDRRPVDVTSRGNGSWRVPPAVASSTRDDACADERPSRGSRRRGGRRCDARRSSRTPAMSSPPAASTSRMPMQGSGWTTLADVARRGVVTPLAVAAGARRHGAHRGRGALRRHVARGGSARHRPARCRARRAYGRLRADPVCRSTDGRRRRRARRLAWNRRRRRIAHGGGARGEVREPP